VAATGEDLPEGGVRRLAAPTGTDERGDVDIAEHDFTGPTLVLIGNETHGLSTAWRQACDRMLRIPITGSASSLNAATAATVVFYEAARQRRTGAASGAEVGPTPSRR